MDSHISPIYYFMVYAINEQKAGGVFANENTVALAKNKKIMDLIMKYFKKTIFYKRLSDWMHCSMLFTAQSIMDMNQVARPFTSLWIYESYKFFPTPILLQKVFDYFGAKFFAAMIPIALTYATETMYLNGLDIRRKDDFDALFFASFMYVCRVVDGGEEESNPIYDRQTHTCSFHTVRFKVFLPLIKSPTRFQTQCQNEMLIRLEFAFYDLMGIIKSNPQTTHPHVPYEDRKTVSSNFPENHERFIAYVLNTLKVFV